MLVRGDAELNLEENDEEMCDDVICAGRRDLIDRIR